MRKSIIFTSVLFLFMLFSTISSAQIVQFGLGGGLTQITTPKLYTGSVANADYGFNGNYHFTILTKFNIPMSKVTPEAFLDYHILRGSGSYQDTAVSTSLSILSVGAEGEYFLFQLPGFKPYVLADLSYNNFSQLQLDIGSNSYVQLSHSNIGGALGIGSEVTIMPKIDFDISAKFSYYNLTGRQSGDDVVRAFTLNIILLF
ncbi:MAG: outer membrane beta-barrel protein [Ignavibacteriaceae bacterium]|nr:outer membrane beta-barrel protein [Ignavibacteriaceae bacterium]